MFIRDRLEHTRELGLRTVIGAGPVVVHTGGQKALAALVRLGYVDALLGGNAVAVHDIEAALLGTSLGIRQMDGRQEEHGHRNHICLLYTSDAADERSSVALGGPRLIKKKNSPPPPPPLPLATSPGDCALAPPTYTPPVAQIHPTQAIRPQDHH